MALQVTGQSQGVFTSSQKSGAPTSLNTGWHAELLKSDLLPRYSYLTLAGKVFTAVETTFGVLTAAGTTTTGLTLWNPANSNVNLVLLDAVLAFTPVTLATVSITAVLAGATQASKPTFGTAITPVSALVGSSFGSVASAGSGTTTIAASPSSLRVLANWESTVLTTSGGATATAALMKDEIAGAIIVQPGAVVTIYGLGTVADASVAASFTWAELPT